MFSNKPTEIFSAVSGVRDGCDVVGTAVDFDTVGSRVGMKLGTTVVNGCSELEALAPVGPNDGESVGVGVGDGTSAGEIEVEVIVGR
jgi:hypothetical protein